MTLLLTLDDGSIHQKLVDAVALARAAAVEEAQPEWVGAYAGAQREDAVSVSHLFEAAVPGYGGWRWSVTVATAGDAAPVTVSEVVLIPGPDALVAPSWVPWERRVKAGDLGVGTIFPVGKDDPRLVPAYLASDDPAVEDVALDAGLGRLHVLSRYGRSDAAARWRDGDYGPHSEMARSAPLKCGTCGFYVSLAGSLRAAFGACTNDISPADGHVVDVEYGCGGHSEVEVEANSSIPVAELVYDGSLIDFVVVPAGEVPAAAEVEAEPPAEAQPPAEVQPVAEPPVGVQPVAEFESVAELKTAEVEPLPTGAQVVAVALATEPAPADGEPVVTDSEPVPAEAQPAPAEVKPVAAETRSPRLFRLFRQSGSANEPTDA